MQLSKVKEKLVLFKNGVLGCWSDSYKSTPLEFDAMTSFDADGRMDADDSRDGLSRQTNSLCLSAGFSLIGYTFLLQFLLHVLNFLLNGLAFRHLDTTSLGLINVRIGLFYSTLMFIARDAFRRACLSRGGDLAAQLTPEKTETASSGSRSFSNRASTFSGLIDLTWTV